MKLATWNVNGIRARYDEVVAFADQERPEIFGLQEIKAAPSQVPEPLTGLPAYFSLWHGAPGGYSGVSLHVRRDAVGAAPRFSHPSFDVETRIVEVALGDVTVASIYVPNGHRNYETKVRFLDALRGYVQELHAGGRCAVLFGDLNVTRTAKDVHPSQRRPGQIGQRTEERELLGALLAEGLVDLGRALHPDDPGLFTWWPPWNEERKQNRGWRLDYVLVSEELAEAATRCEVLAHYGTSDHAPVIAELGRTGNFSVYR